eukprot:TRINITY_DN3030_c0_g2_i11.p1 TRINITY_DN3030_c0_g2~~TRINITY_DN3030_c0_g2_i11.p1  ORF type:complete len:117 (+),score=11.59 TRINITY_DN3030_c0_g2_i11:102-452(+)
MLLLLPLKHVLLCSHRFSIKGRVYPAILPVENKKVTGRVLLGITDPELGVLDTFEDVEYERTAVEVSLVVSIKITPLLILCFLLHVLLLRLFLPPPSITSCILKREAISLSFKLRR